MDDGAGIELSAIDTSDLKQKIGASKAGRRFIAQMRYYNEGDFRRLRGFMRSGYYDLVLMENPVDRRLLDLKATRRLHGRLKVAEVECADDYGIQVIMQGEKGGARLRLQMKVNESYPHQITQYSLEPVNGGREN
ncbi:MAG: hypothetical protein OXG53_12310 [Chloroflexi bacterium]|nr:hypothetical protein [Chloroflexota bacterium]